MGIPNSRQLSLEHDDERRFFLLTDLYMLNYFLICFLPSSKSSNLLVGGFKHVPTGSDGHGYDIGQLQTLLKFVT